MNFTFNINASTEANVTANANAFLIGLQADKLLSANASECVNSALEFYYHEIPTYQVKLYYGSFDEKLFNTTAMLKNLTFDLMVCTDFVHDTVNYTQSQIQMFTSPAAYGLATFQHLVSNIIKLSMIYQEIQDASTIQMNTTEVWLQGGIIVNIIITVPPIETTSYSVRLMEMLPERK